MKINKNRLKEILLEEIAAVAEAAAHRGNPNDPWDALFPAGGAEEHTPMMAPKPVAPSAKDLELAVQRVDELLNSGELSAGGWIEKSLRDIRSILTKSSAGAIEEGEEHTPMMPPKPVKIDPADMYEVSAAVRKFAAEAEGGDRDILEKAAEILQMHSGVLEEGEEAIEEGRCPDTHYWKSFGGSGGTCVKRTDGSKAAPRGPAGGVEQSRRYQSGPKPKRWE